ncbi:MAG: cation diffusion facilitator family transporter [Chlamydiota bacterium]
MNKKKHQCHDHSHTHAHGKALHTALWIAVIFMTLEIIGGWLANSLALIGDALHMFTDVGALLLGVIVVKISARPSTHIMSYGYHRAEILGALASAASLWALCGVLIYESIGRLIRPEEVEGPVVFIIASFGLIANLIMMRILHHGQSHSLNVRAAYLHVLGDLLGSVGVIASGVIIWLTGWYTIDPIVTMFFSIVILWSSGKMIKQSVRILMESTPEHIDPLAIHKDLLTISTVTEVHDLHVWSVSSKKTALSAHIIANDTHLALQEAHRIIEKNYQIHHMTIQVEHPAAFESKFCYDCEKNR